MAVKFRVGDLVWAKMKGFPAWPGKVIEPKPEVKRPSDKKPKHFVFFYGAENYAWIPVESLWSFMENKKKFVVTQRIPRGFKEALEAAEDAYKSMPEENTKNLPTIDDELAQMFPSNSQQTGQTKASMMKGRKSSSVTSEKASSVASSGRGRKSSLTQLKTPKSKKNERSESVKSRTTDKKKEQQQTAKRKHERSDSVKSGAAEKKKPRLDSAKKKKLQDKAKIKSPNRKLKDAQKPSNKKRSLSTPSRKSLDKQTIMNKSAKKGKLTPKSTLLNTKKGRPLLVKLPSPKKSAQTENAFPSRSRTPSPQPLPNKDSPLDFSSVKHVYQDIVHEPPIVPDLAYYGIPPLPKNVIATPMKIGFLGLGIMGTGMVSKLLSSGHEVTVWNRTPSKCRDFMKEGALKGNSPADVIQHCDITFSSVSDPTALKDLVFGNCGVLQGIAQGKAYVDMSTVDVDTITDIHEAVTARGGRFLEAPVIGSREPAEIGQLIILAAGDRTLYQDCFSCFQAMSKKTMFLGEVGSAAKMKLVIDLLCGTVLAGLAESLALSEKLGLDQDEVLKILDMSPVSCPLIKNKGNAMLLSRYSDPHCKLHLMQKDLRLAVNMSDTVDQPLHVGSAVNELFKKAKAKGYGEHDTAAVYRAADL